MAQRPPLQQNTRMRLARMALVIKNHAMNGFNGRSIFKVNKLLFKTILNSYNKKIWGRYGGINKIL